MPQASGGPRGYGLQDVAAAIDKIHAHLERAMAEAERAEATVELAKAAVRRTKAEVELAKAEAAELKRPLVEAIELDELRKMGRDPANKFEVGGTEKLNERGEEICYRLFDAGETIYAVACAMGISFAAAKYRLKRWQKTGGRNRVKRPLD
jgi:hypothetical protein